MRDVLAELQLGDMPVMAVAKGSSRKAGLERVFIGAAERELVLPGASPALHLIQQIRDEAHRFAITGHRTRRRRSRNTSVLEQISGIGAKRRQRLLSEFGGLRALSRAGVEDLARVNGISRHPRQGDIRRLSGRIVNFPNALTLARILVIPVFVVVFFFPAEWTRVVAALAFGAAACTDWLDGYLARRLNQTSRFGAFLDPVADKLLVCTASFCSFRPIRGWSAVPALVIIGRESQSPPFASSWRKLASALPWPWPLSAESRRRHR